MAKMSKKIKKNIEKLNEEAIELVSECIDTSIKFYSNVRKQWNAFEYLYVKGSSKMNTPRGRANLELPIAFQQIEPFVDQMSELLFPEAPFIQFRGRTPDDDLSAEAITEYCQYQLETGQLFPEAQGYLRNLGKLGTAIMKVVWEEDVIERQISPEDMGLPENIEELLPEIKGMLPDTETETLFDGPRFYNLSPFEVFVPQEATNCDVQKMPWIAHEFYRTVDDLLSNDNYSSGKSSLKKLKESLNSDDEYYPKVGSSTVQKETSTESKLATLGNSASTKNDGKIRCIEWWGDLQFNESDEYKKPGLVVIAYPCDEDPIVLRRDENPFKYKFKPFVMSYDYRIEGEPYGYGELNHIKSLIAETTALRNARLDRTNLSLNSMWLVDRQAGVNFRELYTSPDKIILTDDMQGLQKLETTGGSASTVEELGQLGLDIQNTTEIINPKQGVSMAGSGFGRTATGVNYMASRTQSRLASKGKVLQYTFIKPLARILLWYNREFTTDNTWFRVNSDQNNPFRQLPDDAFLADVDYIPEATPIKPTIGERKEQLAYMMQTLAQIEGVVPGVNNFREVLKETWKVSGYNHTERFVNPEGPIRIADMQGTGQYTTDKGQPVEIVNIDPATGEPVPGAGIPPPDGSTPQGGMPV